MPELPEVETIRRHLVSNLVGKEIADVEIRTPKQFIGDPRKILHQTIENVIRSGKVLSFVLKNGEFISIHLKMSGQLLFTPDAKHAEFRYPIPLADGATLPAKTTRVILTFSDGSALFFNDMRKFGWLKLSSRPEGPTSPDAISNNFTPTYLSTVTRKTKKAIKMVLTDQDLIAGIGNIYVNDALYLAYINPIRPANSLSDQEIEKLYIAIKTVLEKSIELKGSSAKDELYVLPDSSKGGYQNHFLAYHQHGKKCSRCGDTFVRIVQGGRSSFYCPTCQPIRTELPPSAKDPTLF
ncbi:bifunctional DNA-formamidopyrimidine glycosylase/DNA-(apurinic or apyrimidinic site) lyase [Candidatus Roizmanbacteria bacterium]|nr:bifunctional DNA-formamidopyrimidine glycosylase/DNA-(apurinic or apyrimidinic site) lyase [Candidatus Roizmanbacteria bacterium]